MTSHPRRYNILLCKSHFLFQKMYGALRSGAAVLRSKSVLERLAMPRTEHRRAEREIKDGTTTTILKSAGINGVAFHGEGQQTSKSSAPRLFDSDLHGYDDIDDLRDELHGLAVDHPQSRNTSSADKPRRNSNSQPIDVRSLLGQVSLFDNFASIDLDAALHTDAVFAADTISDAIGDSALAGNARLTPSIGAEFKSSNLLPVAHDLTESKYSLSEVSPAANIAFEVESSFTTSAAVVASASFGSKASSASTAVATGTCAVRASDAYVSGGAVGSDGELVAGQFFSGNDGHVFVDDADTSGFVTVLRRRGGNGKRDVEQHQQQQASSSNDSGSGKAVGVHAKAPGRGTAVRTSQAYARPNPAAAGLYARQLHAGAHKLASTAPLTAAAAPSSGAAVSGAQVVPQSAAVAAEDLAALPPTSAAVAKQTTAPKPARRAAATSGAATRSSTESATNALWLVLGKTGRPGEQQAAAAAGQRSEPSDNAGARDGAPASATTPPLAGSGKRPALRLNPSAAVWTPPASSPSASSQQQTTDAASNLPSPMPVYQQQQQQQGTTFFPAVGYPYPQQQPMQQQYGPAAYPYAFMPVQAGSAAPSLPQQQMMMVPIVPAAGAGQAYPLHMLHQMQQMRMMAAAAALQQQQQYQQQQHQLSIAAATANNSNVPLSNAATDTPLPASPPVAAAQPEEGEGEQPSDAASAVVAA